MIVLDYSKLKVFLLLKSQMILRSGKKKIKESKSDELSIYRNSINDLCNHYIYQIFPLKICRVKDHFEDFENDYLTSGKSAHVLESESVYGDIKETINMLMDKKFEFEEFYGREIDFKGKECYICFTGFKNGDRLTQCPKKHAFHYSCYLVSSKKSSENKCQYCSTKINKQIPSIPYFDFYI